MRMVVIFIDMMQKIKHESFMKNTLLIKFLTVWLVVFQLSSIEVLAGWNKVPKMILDTLPRMTRKSIVGKPYFYKSGIVYDFSEAIRRTEQIEKLKFHHSIFINRMNMGDQELSDHDLGLHQRKTGKNSLLEYINQHEKAVGVIEEELDEADKADKKESN